jgi:serine/threonine-protein kinase
LRPSADSGVVETQLGTAVGTPVYMSPEQAAGRLDLLGPASDIYSLGATLYVLLTGRAPFEGPDKGEVLRTVQHGDWRPAREVNPRTPPALDAICRKAMALKPEDRYPSALALAADVEHWLADEPVQAWREPWAVRARRWLSRHRTLVTAGAAAVGVALLSLAVATVLLTAANERERDLKRLAEQRERDAEQQRDQAKANFQLAVEAVDEYCTKVSNDPRLKEKDLEGLRQQLLQTAAKFHEEFVRRHAQDPHLRLELGRTYVRLVRIISDIGDKRKARDLARQAADIFKELVADDPGNADYQHELAIGYYYLSNYQAEFGEQDLGISGYHEAIAILEKLTAAYPTEAKYAVDLGRTWGALGYYQRFSLGNLKASRESLEQAIRTLEPVCRPEKINEEAQKFLSNSYSSLAYTYRLAGQPKQGLPIAQKGLESYKRLIQAYPDPDYQNDLARTLQVLAVLYQDLGESDQAAEAYRQAVDMATKLTQTHPAVTYYQDTLATATLNLGQFYVSAGKLDKAAESLHQAIAVSEILVAKHPSVLGYQGLLGGSYNNLATTQMRQGKHQDALAWYDKAIRTGEATFPKGGKPIAAVQGVLFDAHAGRVSALYLLGRHAEATAEAQSLADSKQASRSTLYNAACIHALCVAAARQDGKLPAADRDKLAEQYARRALDLLRQAIQKGYQDVAHMKKDKDLDPLRDRADFQKLLAELEAKGKTEAK